MKSGGSSFENLEEGTYVARICRIIDLGSQLVEDIKTGKTKGYRPKVSISFELPTETIEIDGEDKPRWLSKISVASSHEKSFVSQLVKACGMKFEDVNNINVLLGKPLMIEVGLTSGGKNKVTSVSKLIKGMKVDDLKQDPLFFDFDEPDKEVLKVLPEFIINMLTESKGYKGSEVQKMIESMSKDGDSEEEGTEEEEMEEVF